MIRRQGIEEDRRGGISKNVGRGGKENVEWEVNGTWCGEREGEEGRSQKVRGGFGGISGGK